MQAWGEAPQAAREARALPKTSADRLHVERLEFRRYPQNGQVAPYRMIGSWFRLQAHAPGFKKLFVRRKNSLAVGRSIFCHATVVKRGETEQPFSF